MAARPTIQVLGLALVAMLAKVAAHPVRGRPDGVVAAPPSANVTLVEVVARVEGATRPGTHVLVTSTIRVGLATGAPH